MGLATVGLSTLVAPASTATAQDVVPIALAPTATAQDVVPIALARLLPEGTVVTVQGAATVPSGLFSSATLIRDLPFRDLFSGIYVSIQEDLGIELDDRVRVTGEIRDDGFGNLTLRVNASDDVRVLRFKRRVRPRRINTGAVGRNEGSLVTIRGTVTRPIRDDRPFGFGVFTDDGSGEAQVFIHVSSGINPFEIEDLGEGTEIEVTGLSIQFLEFDEVSPQEPVVGEKLVDDDRRFCGFSRVGFRTNVQSPYMRSYPLGSLITPLPNAWGMKHRAIAVKEPTPIHFIAVKPSVNTGSNNSTSRSP